MCQNCHVEYEDDSDEEALDATSQDITLPPVQEEVPEQEYFVESIARTFGALLGCQATPLLGPRAMYS
ncbi:hypothetical protein CYMTET_9965 [Cymbomonas tetramitiformis]|uniref:Uncharacterized protein n=1 Tax=Cymbomonas tetramitiformis TaxID=36881 RepID=A0AAE0GRP3_9CHLO|nr:hypothetical protein CYMTET_9965 [Cymbomonas tetramitiformis]